MENSSASRAVDMEPTAKRLDEVLDSIPQGLFQFRLLVMCGLALMADAMEVSLLSFISDCAGAEWDLSSSQKATVVSVVFAGQLVGSFCWGSFADYYGRRLAFIMVSIVVSVGGFVSAFAPSYMWLVIFRAVVGFGVGGLIVPYDLLAELSPCSHRGQSLLFTEYFWSFGSLSVAGVAWAVLSTYGWRALTLATAVPVSISSLICLLYLPESPRWLLAEGKIPEAEQVLRDAARVNGVELPPFTLIEETNTMHGEQSEKDGSDCVRITELFDTPKMRKVSMPLATVWFLFGFTYYGLIVFISRIYVVKPEDGGQVCTFAYADIFLNASAEIVGVFSAMMLIDRWGRRLSQMSFYIVASVGVVVLGVMASTGLSSILRIVSGMMARCFVKAALSSTWVITPELYVTRNRATAHSVFNALSRLGGFLSPYLVLSQLSCAGVGAILGCLDLVAAACAYCLPETLGTHLDEQITLPEPRLTVKKSIIHGSKEMVTYEAI